MPKLSIVIPSRDEKFLTPTIDDIFRNARDEQTEVIAVLDSDKWPGDWKEVTNRHPRLHTIHNGSPKGMRYSINAGVASAISRGAKFVAKFDGHCSFSEGFDEILKADCDEDWIVVPRRGRLDPENWCATDTHKPDIDYHYLSFPDDPNDFGGPGLNGKVWLDRAIQRKDILIDDEMSSQGSGWFMHASFFQRMGFMDEANYGPFWNEFQELGMCAWLSGGAVKVNKKCRYLHLHKGSKHGRGYHLPEKWLTQGRNHTMKWPWNEAWDSRQTRPFSWLIEHFWPVPSWPENWEEILYAQRKPRLVGGVEVPIPSGTQEGDLIIGSIELLGQGLKIHQARYGVLAADGLLEEGAIDVTKHLRSLVYEDSLDIVVNNSIITPNENPFRGIRKTLEVVYSFDSGEKVRLQRQEKDWLIIGPAQQSKYVVGTQPVEILGSKASTESAAERDDREERVLTTCSRETAKRLLKLQFDDYVAQNIIAALEGRSDTQVIPAPTSPTTAAALNDYLIRKFSISPQRLRGPMPIELRDFHRNDLAQLFAELGFKRGAEIGVAEGNYSEVLLKANPECELLLVDPWHHYSDNPQGKSKEKHEFALNEVRRKTAGYKVLIYQENSMDAIQQVPDIPLDFVYIDGNHLFDFVMQDLIEWSKRVRSGGIVSGDDYYELDQKRWVGGGVVDAVQAYTKAHRIPVWYIFQGHKSVDFMWVKP